MGKKDFVTGLDIGTTKISGCVGRLDGNKVNIVSADSVYSKGIKGGVVVDIKELTDSIEKLTWQLEKQCGQRIGSVYVNITGPHIQTHLAKGIISISSKDNEITRLDVDRVVEVAKNTSIPFERHILHIFPLSFMIDDQFDIKSPVGMFGNKLGVELYIITSLSTAYQSIIKSIKAAGLSVEELIFSGLATSNAVLSEHEKKSGVILVDIGASTTEIIVIWDDSIRYAEVIPVGGGAITEAISKELKISVEYAETVKQRFGCGSSRRISNDEKLIIKDGHWQKGVGRKYLCDIIEPNLNEILSQIKSRIDRMKFLKTSNLSAVFTGGVSLMEDFLEISEEILSIPIRIGVAKDITSSFKNINRNNFLTSIGLVKYGLMKKNKKIEMVNLTFIEKVKYQLKRIVDEYF